MKRQFFKTVILASFLVFAWTCSSDITTLGVNNVDAKVLETPNGNFYITEDNQVLSETGFVIGHLNEDGTIEDNQGNIIITDVNKEDLKDTVLTYEDSSSSEQVVEPDPNQPASSTTTTPFIPYNPNSSNSNFVTTSSNSVNPNPDPNPNPNPNTNPDPQPSVVSGDCSTSGAFVGCLTQTATPGAKLQDITFSNVSAYPMYKNWSIQSYFVISWDASAKKVTLAGNAPTNEGTYTDDITVEGKTYTLKIIVSGSATPVTPKSSSSSYKQPTQPSSSSKRSSSSSVNQGTSEQIKPLENNWHDGYATRYWDCCKPHCAWPGKGGPMAKTCEANGNVINDPDAKSMCDGGNAGMCRGQFPIVVNENLAYAFAATPGGENKCGKCFELTFTGQGKYATDNHSKLKNKHLIVMSNNIGYDVSGGQFDVMIPGGGVGAFDGCSSRMGWGNQGERYGGLLRQCEIETDYDASRYKSCLQQKCNSSFSSDAKAKEGCLFLANWMEAAGNPLVKYREVECPQALKNNY